MCRWKPWKQADLPHHLMSIRPFSSMIKDVDDARSPLPQGPKKKKASPPCALRKRKPRHHAP
eukprot:scaffold255561_cov22-Tisochrysis_lutea.AAC.1